MTEEALEARINKLEKLVNKADQYDNVEMVVEIAFMNALIREARAALQSPPVDVENYTPGKWFHCKTIEEMSAFYFSRLEAIKLAAKEHGYAIGFHGSGRRDFDLIAMQWRENCSSKDDLARSIQKASCGMDQKSYQWEEKPCGRWAAAFPICWPEWHDMISAGHIDLSVIDTSAARNPLAVSQKPEKIEGLDEALKGKKNWYMQNGGGWPHDDHSKIFKAALAYSRSQKNDGVCEWQPIESAPKDGTRIIVLTKRGLPVLAKWGDLDDFRCWMAVEMDNHPSCWTDGICWQLNDENEESDPPIKWMPAPPAAENGGE